jgi:hypothetical protein
MSDKQPLAPIIDTTPGPIPFTKQEADKFKDTVTPAGPEPTSINDCIGEGGHAGPHGDRWYYPNGKLGPLLGDPRICEICGTIGI